MENVAVSSEEVFVLRVLIAAGGLSTKSSKAVLKTTMDILTCETCVLGGKKTVNPHMHNLV